MISSFIKSFILNIFIYLWSVIFGVLFLPFLILPVEFLSKLPSIWTGPILWVSKKVVGLNFEIDNPEKILQEPVIYACKHQSTWEIFAFPFIIDNMSAIIKKELMYFPIFNIFFKKFLMIPINRKNPKKKNWILEAKKAFQKGRSIFIFPEGTRCSVDKEIPYKSGVFRIYQELNCKVIPVVLNSGYFWPKRGFIKKPGTITVKFLDPIQPGMTKDEFMNFLYNQITSEYNKIKI